MTITHFYERTLAIPSSLPSHSDLCGPTSQWLNVSQIGSKSNSNFAHNLRDHFCHLHESNNLALTDSRAHPELIRALRVTV